MQHGGEAGGVIGTGRPRAGLCKHLLGKAFKSLLLRPATSLETDAYNMGYWC